MNTIDRLKTIVENELVRKLNDNETSSTWEELDLDSLSMVSILRDIEDDFAIEIEYSVFKNHKINSIDDFVAYIEKL